MALKLVVGSELISPKLKAAMDRALDQTGGDAKAAAKLVSSMARNDAGLLAELIGEEDILDSALIYAQKVSTLRSILEPAIQALKDAGISADLIAIALRHAADAIEQAAYDAPPASL
jgi:hypothetical protein